MTRNFLGKFLEGLSKTREAALVRIRDVIRRGPQLDAEAFDQLEEALIQADVGVGATGRILETLRCRVQNAGASGLTEEMIWSILSEQVLAILKECSNPSSDSSLRQKPWVVMVAGVNGAGKTTTVGKLATRLRSEKKRVLLAACDTFRAAGIDQLRVWADRCGADIVEHQPGADAASVAFDAITAARARDSDMVLIDTAGRLHTKVNLMEELKKIQRVLGKALDGAPHEVLLVIDATTGQNAVAQARQFHQDLGVTGLVLAKLDGTAKGGVVVAIAEELGLPLQMVGLGEEADDLVDFDPESFVAALFEAS